MLNSILHCIYHFSHHTHTIFSHVSVIKHMFPAPFSILNHVPYRIFRVDSEFNTPRALGPRFWWIFNESLKNYYIFSISFQKYVLDFTIYIKNYADYDFDTLLYDLYHIWLHFFHIFYIFSYFGVGGYGGAM